MRPDARDRYFEQRDIWMKDLLPYQKHVLADILEVIPTDTASILDVGCGNGIVTNALPESIRVVGLDTSREALKHVRRETVHGDATWLPFDDGAFDLVMANDLIEHLCPADQARALSEMARVSSKYVIVTVPFLEDLNLGTVRCARCGLYYHVNHHVDSFDLSRSAALLTPFGFTCEIQILSGDVWDREPSEMVFLKRLLALEFPHSDSAVCPGCGSGGTLAPRTAPRLSSTLDRMALETYLQEKRSTAPRSWRTECIALYTKHGNAPGNSLTVVPPESLKRVRFPVNRVDCTIPSLFRRQFLPKYSRLPYYHCNDVTAEGAAVGSGERLLLGFFCDPLPGRELGLRLSGTAGESSLTICPYDRSIGYHSPQTAQVSGAFDITVPVPGAGLSVYGVLFEIRNDGAPVVFRQAELLGANGDAVEALLVPPSARYMRLSLPGNVALSMTFYEGWCPWEEWMGDPARLAPADVPVISRSDYSAVSSTIQRILDEMETERQSLSSRNEDLGRQLEGLRLALDSAESIRDSQAEAYDALSIAEQSLRIAYNELETRHSEMKAEHDALASSDLALRVAYDDLLRRYGEMKAEHDALASSNRALRAEIEESKHALESLQGRYSELSERFERTLSRRLRRRFLALGRGPYESYVAFRGRILQCAAPTVVDQSWRATGAGAKRFLMLCHDQDIDRRIVQQAAALIERGWHGMIVALSFDGDDHLDTVGGIRVHRVGLNRVVPECPVYWRYQNRQRWVNWWGRYVGFLSRLNWLLYKLQLLWTYRCRRIAHPLPFDNCFYQAGRLYRPDVLIAHDLTSLTAAHRLTREWEVPLVYDAHELYYEQRVFSRTQKRIARKVEETLIHKCDVAITVNQSIANEMSSRYGCRTPEVLLNVVDAPADLDLSQPRPLLREHLGLPEDATIVLFQGGFVPNRNLENMVRSMEWVRSAGVVMVLMGNGPLLERLRAVVGERRLQGRVFFKAGVPQAELLHWTASADIGIIPYPHVDMNSYYCTPNKLFEYIQAGVPMIGNDSPELRRFIQDTGFGVVGRTSTAREIGALIDSFVSQPQVIEAARKRILERRREFSWGSEATRYVSMVEGLIRQVECE